MEREWLAEAFPGLQRREKGLANFSESEVIMLARGAYQTGNASFSVAAEECALLVIDMQEEFVKSGWTPFWVPEATRQIPKIQRLIDCCRTCSVPVIYTVFAATHHFLDRPCSGQFMPNRYPDVRSRDDDWFREGRVCSELAPLPEEIVIQKPSYGAFYDTPLDTILRNLNRRAVIICGTLTNYCCGTTARQAYERGYKVLFGSDVCATDDMELQQAELSVLRKGFARVLGMEEIITLLIGHA